jgi:hypothetical protein
VADPSSTPVGAPRPLAPGTKVEVRRRYDNRWSRGFEVAAVDGDGYLVRRRSDGTVIPAPFSRSDLRRERQGDWWF